MIYHIMWPEVGGAYQFLPVPVGTIHPTQLKNRSRPAGSDASIIKPVKRVQNQSDWWRLSNRFKPVWA